MSNFERTPTRYNITPLRTPSEETKLRLELERQLREQALADFTREERRLTRRITRVVRGVSMAAREITKVAWQAAWGK